VSVDLAWPPAPRPWWRRLPGSSARILLGLAAGVFTGLFFGEAAAALQPAADTYIRLMQMTVLPYLLLTLIGGLGQLDHATARRLGGRAVLLAGLLIALSLGVVAVMPMAFPVLESASFYSDALIEPRLPFALGEMYVPANPFHAMANTIVPAVVLFSTAVGLALIGVPGKAPLLATLRALELAVVRVTRFVLLLTPLGVFAITAAVAGTMDPQTLLRLEVYLVVFALGSLLLCFVVLPLVVTAITPFTYRQVVTVGQEALITAFVASSAFIVLPMVVERVKDMLATRAMASAEARSAVDVVVPISFVIPNAGKLLTLLFVPYAAWLAGDPMSAQGLGTLFAAGVPSYFAKAQVALPFLMDLVGVPHDLFQLYIPSSIITGKFDSMVTVMSLLALSLTTAAAVSGRLQLQWRRVLPAAGLIVVSTALLVTGARLLLAAGIDTTYRTAEVLGQMHLPRQAVPSVVLAEAPPPETGAEPRLQRILARGVLRVAFVADRVPFSFTNVHGDLVGMDVELAGRLARDLGVARVEFVPADFRTMASLLAEGRIDIAMGMPYLRELLPQVAFSAPYMESRIGLVVPDADRDTFGSVAAIRARSPVTIGLLVDSPGMQELLREHLPGAELRFVELGTPRGFMAGEVQGVDAFAMLAEAGAAWSILYPAFSVVVPQPNPIVLPVGVATRRGDRDLADFIDDWLVIQRASGELARARDYWVLGQGASPGKPRWSIRRDVLGWGVNRPPPTPVR
jgi:Na+/H+-dicarboxylate symporter